MLEPNNPEAHYALSTYYCDEACRNTALTEARKREYVKNGLAAVDKAIALNPDYVEAITYRGLLLRMEAAMEKNSDRQDALLKEATALHERAVGLKAVRGKGSYSNP